MTVLLSPEDWVLRKYPKLSPSNEYKLSDYIINVDDGENVILMHTITWSIFSLTHKEFSEILDNQVLRSYNVVVPKYFDELPIANDVYLSRVSPSHYPTFDKITHFTVLTTTSCNARCFYCYEDGIDKNLMMSTKVADDVVKFIHKHASNHDEQIEIQWFGGEPLLNTRVIDYITDKLYELNIDFRSSIITNAFLLDEEIAKKLVKWKVSYIQITLDGLYDDYNNIKNYIYTDVDAYLKVIDNIHKVLNSIDCRTAIKLNATNENIFKLYNDILILKEEFKDHLSNPNLMFVVATLFEYIKDPDMVVEGYWTEFDRLREISYSQVPNTVHKFFSKDDFRRTMINFQCKAYDGATFIILPDGRLVRCGLIRPDDIYGDIYKGITNIDVLDAWMDFDGPEIDYCKSSRCPLHPVCPKFYRCNSCGVCSQPHHIDYVLNLAKDKLRRTIKLYNDL